MKISDLKEKVNNLLDKRSVLIVAAQAIHIHFPELRDNNELKQLIKEKNLHVYELLSNFWTHYMNYYYCAKNIIENGKSIELTSLEREKLNQYSIIKEESKDKLIEELKKIKLLNY
jgi:hypothetical protein